MQGVFNDMMIDSPDNIKWCKSKYYDELKEAFSPEYAESKYKKHTGSKEKEIIKWVSFELFVNVFDDVHT